MDPVPEALDARALDAAVDARPDVRQLAEARLSMERRARYVKMLYLPSLGATGKIGVTAYDTDQLFDFDKNKEWQVGIGLNWNIFDGGSKWAQAQQTLSEARQMRLNEQIVRKTALVEIERAYRDYRAADTALMAAEQAVAAAREAQAMLSEDFRAGKGQVTDLLETDEALLQAEFGVLGARYQRVRSQAALRLALGKGLINEEAP
jgi:outer membrane protein TolC